MAISLGILTQHFQTNPIYHTSPIMANGKTSLRRFRTPARLFDLGWRIDFLHAPERSETSEAKASERRKGSIISIYKQPKEIQKRSDLLTTTLVTLVFCWGLSFPSFLESCQKLGFACPFGISASTQMCLFWVSFGNGSKKSQKHLKLREIFYENHPWHSFFECFGMCTFRAGVQKCSPLPCTSTLSGVATARKTRLWSCGARVNDWSNSQMARQKTSEF